MLPNEFMGKNLHYVNSANSSSKSEVTLAAVTPLSTKTSLIFVKVSLVNWFERFFLLFSFKRLEAIQSPDAIKKYRVMSWEI